MQLMYVHSMVLESMSWHKGGNADSIRSLVVDEERMRPGQDTGWDTQALYVPCSALTWMVGLQAGHLTLENPFH